jgi:regulator of sigma E protease
MVATIGHVVSDSPAAKAGIRDGDRIVEIEGKTNPTWDDVNILEFSSAGRTLSVVVLRNGKRITTTVTPVLSERVGIGTAGWSQEAEIQVVEVVRGMPAEKAGIRPGDLLLSLNGRPVRSLIRFHEAVRASEGNSLAIELMRDGRMSQVSVQPVYSAQASRPGEGERWMIGVGADRRVVYAQLPLFEAIGQSVRQNVRGATLIYELLRGIVARRMSARTIDGPIGIARLSGDAAREGAYTFINLMAAVSLNLAIINLLPIPVLDGGVILLLLFEMLIRRDLSLPVKEAVFKFGFVFLLMIMAFAIYNDISKIMMPAG